MSEDIAATTSPGNAQRPAQPRSEPIRVERWPTEIPLFLFVVLAALAIWALLALSIFGLVYALFLAVFFFFSHVVFITYLRGSSVRLGPSQFPELYQRVVELSQRAGLDRPPETYVQSAGGSLNAFATKFFRSSIMVLYSDLLEACGDDLAARDMVIAHELGHHKSGHLRFNWLLIPGLALPFLGSAYSRAREFTCDRFGKRLCPDREGAVRGLTILAAGKDLGPDVDIPAFIEQSRSLSSPWMTLGRWLAFYPQLCERVDAMERDLDSVQTNTATGTLGALAILGSLVVGPLLLVGGAMAMLAMVGGSLSSAFEGIADLDSAATAAAFEAPDPNIAAAQLEQDFTQFEALLRGLHAAARPLPEDSDELYAAWRQLRDDEPPVDPFDGIELGFHVDDGSTYVIWSSGPDGEPATDDDIERRILLE